ncbi:MAG: hypothetical protein LBN02_08935 [Oscillospiraceae bacterium]|jgi:hypothetical protein|nr:hypothetical protein [Oscillospiraceae bacterium]
MSKQRQNSSFNPSERISERLVLNYDIERVFSATIQAVGETKGFALSDSNEVLHRIIVKTKASLFSWGEKMTVQLSKTEEGTELSISSELKTSIGSQGIGTQETIGKKNKKNIDKLLDAISRYV